MSSRVVGEGFADANTSNDPGRLARAAVRQATSSLREASVVFGFVTSVNGRKNGHDPIMKAAQELRVQCPKAVVIVSEAPGVIAGPIEREGAAAVSVLAFDAAVMRARLGTLSLDAERDGHTSNVAAMCSAMPEGARSIRAVIALLAPIAHTPEALMGLAGAGTTPVVGGGTSLLVAAQPGRDPEPVGAAVLSVASSLGVSLIAATSGRTVTPWLEVEAQEGPFIMRAGGRSMLDLVGSESRGTPKEQLLVAVRGLEGEVPLLRSIVGADTARGAVAIGDVLPPGAEIALALRDAAFARSELVARVSAARRAQAGATPTAGLMFTCAGRGSRFYGRQDVDAGVVRARFQEMPLAGMQSAFELAPWSGATRVHLYTASCAVFYRLS